MIAAMPPSPPALLDPNAPFGPYKIVRLLGQGTFGSVYEALRLPVGKRVALKVLDPKLANRPEAIARFEREAYATASLDHPNIVTVFDVGEEQGCLYLKMEYLDGETLEGRLTREGALSPTDLAEIFLPLLSALAKVHEQGYVHRDLKPANVFLSHRVAGVVEPKLLDFGMVKPDEAHGHAALTRKGALLGSPAYMSPEQAEAKSVDQRSDLFSLGTILWECTTGQRLFAGNSLIELLNAVVNVPIAAPSKVRPSTPRELDGLILNALQRDPSRRFQTAREMARVMLSIAAPAVRDRWSAEFGGPTTVESPAGSLTVEPIARTESPDDALEAATTPLDTFASAPGAVVSSTSETVPLNVVSPIAQPPYGARTEQLANRDGTLSTASKAMLVAGATAFAAALGLLIWHFLR